MVKAIVGTQWGDEGKGRIIEIFAEKADVVARYNGGANCGHTIYRNGKKLVFRLVPSGIIYPHTLCVIGNGVAVDPETLIKEINLLKESKINVNNRLFISDSCHIVMPYHKLNDDPNGILGTTKKGIGPCYEDKYRRIGIRMKDLLSKETFKEKLKNNIKRYTSISFDEIYNKYLEYGKFLSKFVADTPYLLNKWIDEGKEILLEGAQGLLLDIDHGTYPFVTSSNPHIGGACTGLGIGATKIDEVIGVVKSYVSRVGEGPLPTRLPNDLEIKLREKGKEYGSATGRPRKLGWLDLFLVKRALLLNDIKKIVLTKLDVLDILSKIKICVDYKNCEPVYEEMDGWLTNTSNIRTYNNLPQAAKIYINKISSFLSTKIIAVCVGEEKHQTIFL